MVVMLSLLVMNGNQEIAFTQKQLRGLIYTAPLHRIQLHIAEHRGALGGLLGGGGDTFRQRATELARQLDGAIAQLNEIHRDLGAELAPGEAWSIIQQQWQRLQAEGSSLTRSQSFARHTELIGQVLNLISAVADSSNLILDPDLDSIYLILATLVQMPKLTEYLGQTRALATATAAEGQFTDTQARNRLIGLSLSIPEALGDVRRSVNTAIRYNASLAPALESSLAESDRRIADFVAHINRELLATEAIQADAPSLFREATATIDQFVTLYDVVVPQIDALLKARIDRLTWERNSTIGLSLAAVAVTLWLSFAIAQTITAPLRRAVVNLEKIANGQLEEEIWFSNDEEMGRLLGATETMRQRLRGIVHNVRESAEAVNQGANELQGGISQLADRTEQQASSLEETAASMEEMTSTVKQNAANASQADSLSGQARITATEGLQVMRNAVSAMNDISMASRKIVDIISVINEIAFQTNLLALNASVEAARAGDQGRGFAVVASEVRNLAGRSATAAEEIKRLIQDSVAKIENGTQLVSHSGQSLEQIVRSVEEVSRLIAEIAAASREQSSGIEQVNQAVMQMESFTQQNAALVEETTAASETMREQAGQLVSELALFQGKA